MSKDSAKRSLSSQGLRHFRFGLRTLFGFVTVVGLIMGLWRHGVVQQQRAAKSAMQALGYATWTDRCKRNPNAGGKATGSRYWMHYQYHMQLREKYRRSVWQPWLLWKSDPKPPPDLL